MSMFKSHSILLNIPKDKAQAVLEKITGEYGKLIRENYDLKPFTGTVKEDGFSIIPNLSSASIKLKGKLSSENMNQTRLEIKGEFLIMKLIAFVFVTLAVGGLLISLSSVIVMTEHPILGLLTVFFPILVIWQLFYLVLGHPKSDCNDAIYQLMRKMDLHEYVL